MLFQEESGQAKENLQAPDPNLRASPSSSYSNRSSCVAGMGAVSRGLLSWILVPDTGAFVLSSIFTRTQTSWCKTSVPRHRPRVKALGLEWSDSCERGLSYGASYCLVCLLLETSKDMEPSPSVFYVCSDSFFQLLREKQQLPWFSDWQNLKQRSHDACRLASYPPSFLLVERNLRTEAHGNIWLYLSFF